MKNWIEATQREPWDADPNIFFAVVVGDDNDLSWGSYSFDKAYEMAENTEADGERVSIVIADCESGDALGEIIVREED